MENWDQYKRETGRFRLERGGTTIEVIEYGARLVQCMIPDHSGRVSDVVPGFLSAADYATRGGVWGAIVGRYGNRISAGSVTIGDTTYNLSWNDPPNTMHGGAHNFSTRYWHGKYVGNDTIRLSLESPDGDQGWPGNVQVQVDYTLGEQGELTIEMRAVSDKDTYLNLLFHGYWNLAGHDSGTILGHWLKVAAEFYLPKSQAGVPSGEILSVSNTPFDFTEGKLIGRDIAQLERGYGHNLCLKNYKKDLITPALVLACPESGRVLSLSTDQPGVQLYTANLWSGLEGKDGAIYGAHDAVALETQLYPNSANTPTFNPSPLRAGEVYKHRMEIRFSTVRPQDLENWLQTNHLQ